MLNHIVITGASGGIGKELALVYADKGIQLSLFGRRETELNELAKRCEEKGASVSIYCLDVCDTDKLIRTIEAIDLAKPVDLVIANAGIANYLDASKTAESLEEIKQTIDTNLMGAIATITPLIQRMRHRKKGQIALISSFAAFYGLAVSPSYCASKAGLKAYGEALRDLLKPDNIKVSVVCPGFIESAMSDQFPGKKPLVQKAANAAWIIKKGLQANRAYITFPYFLGLGLRYLTLLPSTICQFVLRRMT